MFAWIVSGGLGLLIGIAVLIGQRSAQEHAWRAIAGERRDLNETRRALDGLAVDLTEEGLRLQEWEDRLAIRTELVLGGEES